jgi:hypothetical protein
MVSAADKSADAVCFVVGGKPVVFFSILSWKKFASAHIAGSNVNSVSRKLASCHFKEQVSQLYHSKQ